MGGDNVPICLQSCAHDGVRYGEFEENKDEHIYKVSEYVMVKTNYKWERAPEPPIRKR